MFVFSSTQGAKASSTATIDVRSGLGPRAFTSQSTSVFSLVFALDGPPKA